MPKVRVYENLDECRQIWQNNWTNACVFDLWPVRDCFQKQYNNRPYFLVAERHGKLCGLLALSWIEEKQCFGHFPGEIWQGKTWLEQNKIAASDTDVFKALLRHIPGEANIRYLTRESMLLDEEAIGLDEIGYLFFPGQYGYSFQVYMQQFSGKSRKKLGRELDRLQALGLSIRYDSLSDVDLMFRMNLEAFGEWSYFNDPRFMNSFENLLAWLHKKGLLRVTTVLLGGKVAAVDVGAIRGSSYTVFGGGTHPEFPGVAKLMNFHHLEWACCQRLAEVDFLCGNFGWKERFHLTPRPLYQMHIPLETEILQDLHAEKRIACA
ncbi:MAG: GNAT family N-acetyltransferase [Desulfobacteraceae bacterium]|nr:GNAT family N-acetyltransferase [Desulfobacteraceae bacterium]